MTMDERVEAAESALMNSKMWPVVFAAGAAHEVARIALAAAFPELHGDKTHWLAPVEPADEMIRAGRREAAYVISDAASIYRAMGAAARGEHTEASDAHLGKGDGG